MRFNAPVIGVLVALLLTVAFWFLLYKPADERQAAVEAETAELEQRESALRAQIAQLRDIESRQVEIRAALARLEEFIPSGPAQPTVIRQFQRAADASGTEIATIGFAEPTVPTTAAGAPPSDTGEPGTILAEIPLNMTVQGGYFQLVDFFRRLEVEVPRAVLVESLNVAESAEEGFPTLSADWTGQLFAVVPASDLTDVQAGVPAPGATETPTEPPAGGES